MAKVISPISFEDGRDELNEPRPLQLADTARVELSMCVADKPPGSGGDPDTMLVNMIDGPFGAPLVGEGTNPFEELHSERWSVDDFTSHKIEFDNEIGWAYVVPRGQPGCSVKIYDYTNTFQLMVIWLEKSHVIPIFHTKFYLQRQGTNVEYFVDVLGVRSMRYKKNVPY